MMNYDAQLKIQAFLDGELPEDEARVVANQLAADREAVALLGELRNTRQAMAGFESQIRLPESREFFWSKIRREIERLEPAAAPVAKEHRSVFGLLRRVLLPVGCVAAAVIAALLILPRNGGSNIPFAPVETAFADAGALTYRDFSSGTTLVWISYPAENDLSGQNDFDSFE